MKLEEIEKLLEELSDDAYTASVLITNGSEEIECALGMIREIKEKIEEIKKNGI